MGWVLEKANERVLEEFKIGPGRETGKGIECPAVWELGLKHLCERIWGC